MKLIVDFFPILLFFAAFKFYGIYAATAVAIGASLVQTAYFWAKHRRFESLHLITLAMVVVFGGATLIFHDDAFIKWKFSMVNWLLGAVFLFTHYVGDKPLLKRMLESQISLPDFVWRRMNMVWIVYFLFLGFANLYVMQHFDTDTWVDIKTFGDLALTILLTLGQGFYMYRYLKPAQVSTNNNNSHSGN
jgi:intracellular septation protein